MSVRKHMYSRVVTSFKKSMRLFISCVRPDQRESQEIFGFTARKEVNITRNEQTVGPWKLQEQSITDSTICNPPETEITEENEIPFLALQEESMGSLVTDELSEKSSSDEVILPVTQVLPPSARTSNNPITSVQPGSESLFQYYQKRIGRFIIERHEHLHARFTIPLLPEVHEADVGKKCLVLDLDETLIHSQFNKVDEPDLEVPIEIDHGTVRPIYVSKRPGVDQFLAAVGQHFEVVIFTASLASVSHSAYYYIPVFIFVVCSMRTQ